MEEKVSLYLDDWERLAMTSLSELQTKGVLCDTLLVSDQGEEIPCHGCIIAAVVPVLKVQLTEEYSEKMSGKTTSNCLREHRNKVVWKGICGKILHSIVKFCYCGNIEIVRNEIPALLDAANSLKIEPLSELCQKLLVSGDKKLRNTIKRRKNMQKVTVKRTRNSQNMIDDTPKFSSTLNDDDHLMKQHSEHDSGLEHTLPFLTEETFELLETNVSLSESSNLENNTFKSQVSLNSELDSEILNQDTLIPSELHNFSETDAYIDKQTVSFLSDEPACIVNSESSQGIVPETTNDVVTDNTKQQQVMDTNANDAMEANDHGDPLEGEEYINLLHSDSLETRINLHYSDIDKERESKHNTTHLRDIGKKNSFECNICGKKFTNESSLSDHMNLHNGIKPYTCSLCGKSYCAKTSLNDHMKIHGGKEFECKICGKKLLSQKRLYAHQKTHGPNWQPKQKDKGNYNCTLCNKHFTSFKSLGDHMNIHRGIKPYKCETCERTYSSRISLREHQAIHKNEQHICDTCGKSYVSRKYLRRHINEHRMNELKDTTGPSFKCDLCDKKYHSAQNLRKHQDTVHTDNNGYICPACGQKCKSKTTMDNHYAYCTQTGKFNCDFCDKKYVTNEALRKHITWAHRKEMLESDKYKKDIFYCSFCGKPFLAKSLLQVHENLHTGAQKFNCDLCSKSFNSSSNLGTHRRNVHIDTPDQYQCKICNSTTKSLRAFKRHEKLHSKNPEYSCKNCGKNYNRRDMLNAHLQTCVQTVPVAEDYQPIMQDYFASNLTTLV